MRASASTHERRRGRHHTPPWCHCCGSSAPRGSRAAGDCTTGHVLEQRRPPDARVFCALSCALSCPHSDHRQGDAVLRHPVLPCAPLSQTSRFAEAEAETPLLTALAAKGVQVDRLEDPFPLIHNARPPQSPAPAPWTPPPHHEPLRIFRPAPASTRLRVILSSALLWRGGHRPPPARTLRHIRIVGLGTVTVIPVLGR
jgi:hypothetical protein